MNKRGMDAVGFIGITIIVVAIIVLSLGGLNNVWAQIKAIMGGGDTVETVISQCSFACSRGGKSGSWAYCSIKRPMMDTTSKKRYSGTCNEYANAGSFFSQFFLCDNTEIKCAATSLCGNGRIDSGEECDQNDLGANIFSDAKLTTSNACTALDSTKYNSGIVSCTACKMDLTDCVEKITSPGSSATVTPPVVTPPVVTTQIVVGSIVKIKGYVVENGICKVDNFDKTGKISMYRSLYKVGTIDSASKKVLIYGKSNARDSSYSIPVGYVSSDNLEISTCVSSSVCPCPPECQSCSTY